MIYGNADGNRVTVPFHAGMILHPKTFQHIPEEAGITVDEHISRLS